MRHKAILCGLMAAMLFSVVGCASSNLPSTIIQDQSEIQAGVALTTTVALMTMPTKNRQVTAQYVYEGGYALHSAVVSGPVDLAQFNNITQALLKNVSAPEQVILGSIMQTVGDFIFNTVQNYINSNTTQQGLATQALLTAAANGMMAGSLPFAGAVPTPPTTQPSSSSGKIVLRKLTWTPISKPSSP